MREASALRSVLCCPRCHGDLLWKEHMGECPSCEVSYPVRDGRYFFREVDLSGDLTDGVDRLKFRLKRFALYQWVIALLSPVLPNGRHREAIRASRGLVVNIGSGNSRLGDAVVNVDMFPYRNVDIVADIQQLPFKMSSVDTAICVAVLEHVRQPERVVDDIYRVLVEGGSAFVVIPFMQPFHASPHDYQRYTRAGIDWLHRRLQPIETGMYGGPVSGFLWVFQEFVAILLSFGNLRLRAAISIAAMLVTWPLKGLDFVFRRFSSGETIASSFYFWGSKEESPSGPRASQPEMEDHL